MMNKVLYNQAKLHLEHLDFEAKNFQRKGQDVPKKLIKAIRKALRKLEDLED